MTVIIFIAVLAVLIFVHELGHFVAARACGIRVDEFKIGFGPKIFYWRRGETEYGINLIPFGGFVKIFGENPDDVSMNGPDAARSFVNKPRWQQFVVLVAGVVFNFIFAWIIYATVFTTGVTATRDGFEAYSSRFQNPRIMVTDVLKDSPADKAGLKIGDVISNVIPATQSPQVLTPQQNIAGIQTAINNSKGSAISIQYLHDGKPISVEVTPVSNLVADKYAIGIAMDDAVDLRLPFFTAIYEGGHYTLIMMRDTVLGLYDFFSRLVVGKADFSSVSGPVGIAGIVGTAAGMGLTYLLMVTAVISINLGIINLVPFPALDGGRALFVILESVFRRRIPARVANITNMVGFALLMALMVIVTYKDIVKLVK